MLNGAHRTPDCRRMPTSGREIWLAKGIEHLRIGCRITGCCNRLGARAGKRLVHVQGHGPMPRRRKESVTETCLRLGCQ
jgi:hypothetical protein